ncbi:MAG: hypothetical protein LBU77_07185 [Clostridiales bacterium]|jgi:hypothetical protein|nr:hypothetical protein [Clostridiales bacterium]
MNKYTINKLGFVDFWFYDFQEFECADGRLLLRGTNGSGKSVTMQSFIPLLLDGNKTPSRLDPSGSNDKRIENYMLDDTREERTAYLYMEFKNSTSYVTIGMGMKAEKNKQLDSWYFIVNDGRRINIDLMLYEGNVEKIALSKQKLQNRVLPNCFFTTKQGEYMRKVNELIFGYEEHESYEDLLNLLIQVRAPKISKDFKPATLYGILKDSLKVLSDDDLRAMSEAMQNMDDLSRRQKLLKSAIKAANFVQTKYDAYNKKILLNKAMHYQESSLALNQLLSDQKKSEENHLYSEENLIKVQAVLNQKRAQLSNAETWLMDYKDSDIGKIVTQIEELKSDIQALEGEQKELSARIEKMNVTLNKALNEQKEQQDKAEKTAFETEEAINEANGLAMDTAFPYW